MNIKTTLLKSYKRQQSTFEWVLRKLLILQRDEFKCQKCGNQTHLHVHHKKYANDNREIWDYPDGYLITLCNECHEKEHNNIPLCDFYTNVNVAHYKFPKHILKAFGRK